MRTIELFAGTGSFSKVAKKQGHSIYRIDNNSDFDLEVCINIFNLLEWPISDILWASPPCTTFSVASLGHHWTGGKGAYIPKTDKCKEGLKLLDHLIKILSISLKDNPKLIWFIENPRGVMRKVIDDIFKKYNITDYERKTITYCQYGDNRMKPTDIWTNFKEWIPKPMCKNGDSCHQSAPRGSRTGTQGLKGNKERSIIPPKLFEEIFKQLNEVKK